MKSRISYAVAAFAAASVFGAALFADTLSHSTAGVNIWVPDNWSQEGDDNMLIAGDPNEEIIMVFGILEASEIDAAIEEMDRELSQIVENAEPVGEPEEVKINGMDAIVMDGKGSVEGTPVEMGIALIATPNKKILLVFGVVEATAAEKHEATVEKIMMGIKPM